MYTPKTAAEAARLARSAEKAQALLAAGYLFLAHIGPNCQPDGTAVIKPGETNAAYVLRDGRCDCPDFVQHGNFCKHTIAAELKRKREDELNSLFSEDALNALFGESEDEDARWEAMCREEDLRREALHYC